MGSPEGEGNADEHPRHKVTVERPFAVGKYEITWDDWDACVAMRGCDGAPTGEGGFGKGGGRQPVINVSWDQATSYVAWLSRVTGKDYRLLSEAEWEYAARAGSTTVYSFGDDPKNLCEYANLADQSSKRIFPNWTVGECDDGEGQIAKVGSKKPNAFGLYDMHGNVFEWVEDCLYTYKDEPRDASAITSEDCSRRVLRGGSWNSAPVNLRSALRIRNTTDGRLDYIGFRVGRTLER